MKKSLSLLLCILLIVLLTGIVKADGTGIITLTPSKTLLYVGDEVTVTMKVTPAIEAADFKITFDDTALEFISTSLKGAHRTIEDGVINVSTYYEEDNDLGMDTFTFTFKTLKTGTSRVSTDIENLFVDTSNRITAENKFIDITVSEKPQVIDVTSVTLDKTSGTLKEKETIKLIATVLPEDATDKEVTWTSSDNTIATVSNGTVTAVKEGTATITAKAGEKTATYVLTVEKEVKPDDNKKIDVTSITLDKTTAKIKVDETIKLNATILPEDATNKEVTWTSSDTSIAKVVNGTVTALKAGTVTITAKAGDKTATSTITVEAKANTNDNTSGTGKDDKNSSTSKTDNTTAKTPIPQTGETFTVIISIVTLAIISVYSILRYRRYKDI